MRYKRILISGMFLVTIATEGILPEIIVHNGLPLGTKFAYAIPDATYGIWIVVEHESFPELKNGDEIPVLNSPIFERGK